MVYAVVGLQGTDGTFQIPSQRKLGEALGVKSPYGIRNRREAEYWLSQLSHDIVGIVYASSETNGLVEHVGEVPDLAAATAAVEEQYLLRNQDAESVTTEDSGGFVPITPVRPGESTRLATTAMPVTQRESDLLMEYQDYLMRYKGYDEEEDKLKWKSVHHCDGDPWLRIDAFDEKTGCLIEAKSSSHRTYVLHAIAQLLDYGRLVEHKQKMVLLPEEPAPDLIDLAGSLSIAICYKRADGTFDIASGSRIQ